MGGAHCQLAQSHQRGIYAPFRRIVSTRFDLGGAPLSDYAVCQKLGIPALDITQAVQGLLHLARVLQHGPDWLWSLMHSQAGKQCRECAFLDLEFMAAVLHDKLADLGDPRVQWQRWQAFILGVLVDPFLQSHALLANRCLLHLCLGTVMSVG